MKAAVYDDAAFIMITDVSFTIRAHRDGMTIRFC